MNKFLVYIFISIVVTFSSVSYSQASSLSGVPPVRECQALSEQFLQNLKEQNIPASIFLINGIKLQGIINNFDCEVILLQNTTQQMVYRHAVSTIVPGIIQ